MNTAAPRPSFINDIDATIAEQTRVIGILHAMSPAELLQQLKTSTAKAESDRLTFDQQREAHFYQMLTEREILKRMGA